MPTQVEETKFPIGWTKSCWEIERKDITIQELDWFINGVKSPKYKAPIEAARLLLKEKGKPAYLIVKEQLPAICFGRFSDSVINANYTPNSSILFNGDIDGLTEEKAERVKDLISSHHSTVYCFISPSGLGVKFGINVDPIKDDAHYKQLFAYMKVWVKDEIDNSIILDENCKDVRRLCFQSYDPSAYLNLEADILPIPPESLVESIKALIPTENSLNKAHSDTITANLTNGLGSVKDEIVAVITNMMLKAPDGDRHGTRINVSRLAGGYVAGGLLGEDEALELLTVLSDQIADGRATSNSELKTIMDGFNFGLKAPLFLEDYRKQHGYDLVLFDPAVSNGNGANRFNTYPTDVRDGTATTRPLTEYGNAQRLSDIHADNVKYIDGAGQFTIWDGSCLQWDFNGAKTRTLAAELHKIIYKEGERYQQQAVKFAVWGRASQSESTIKATVSLYKDFPQVRVPLQLIDGNKYMVGLDSARQVIDLKTGVIRPAERNDYITKALNVDSMGQALKAKRWLLFLNEVFGDDPDLIYWLQRWCGYILTGSTAEQCFLFLYGFGANGKSVLIDTIRYVLGEYARAIASETLTETKRAAGSASPDLADLIGARLALTTETEDGVALAESLLKALTGGDTLTARKLYSAPTQFTPQFKIMMSGNHKPLIKGNDDGIWRRVRLLPFTRTFSDTKKDTHLSEKLRAEAPHILAWMVEGCLAWQQNGLADIPATIKVATADYKEDQDLIAAWLADCCKLSTQCESLSTTLYNSYKFWCETNGLMKSSNKVFGRRLAERGFIRRKSNNKQFWSGVEIIPHASAVSSSL